MKQILTLIKWRIALLSAISATAGALLTAPSTIWKIVLPVIGTYLLACGAAALNQIQERNLDAQMPRTRLRPLPSGRMPLTVAKIITGTFLLTGLGSLALTGHLLTVILGVSAVLSYNALYTPLKRITPWAPVIGAVVGAFAPAIGWVGSGGTTNGPALFALIIFFVVWQVPHFWLLFFRTEREYAAAGLPVLTDKLNLTRLKRVTVVWIFATATLGLLLPVFGAIHHLAVVITLAVVAVWLAWSTRGILSPALRADRQAFAAINAFAVTLLGAIIFEQVWRSRS